MGVCVALDLNCSFLEPKTRDLTFTVVKFHCVRAVPLLSR